ncbi:cation:proton antiporter regulatory subunit [Saliphagus infecundisoli]|uniref:Cation:proton antiporter regulatory subunit n=1 Tax=Saliphagus infecundisoli TaxID=1849069 RepID=A0ABD5QIA0_9EURY|nr:TrkA C-terminal domain-containing protein [Saliphagus infecundisoli]
MRVFETQLPGVGQRYQITFSDGGVFTIVIHNDGSRQVFWRDDPDDDGKELFTTTERDAQKLAEIFEGVFFDPVADDLDDALSGARIKWVAIPGDSPVVGQTISDLDIRARTGISILAVERGDQTIANPESSTELLADDILVIVGDDDAHQALDTLLSKSG